MPISRFGSLVCLALVAGSITPSRAAAQRLEPDGRPVGGISCDAMEGNRLHIHQHLAIFDHGKAVGIPPNVGQPGGKGCLYWLHTHTPDGFIHVEAPLDRTFTLGDFFRIWGKSLSPTGAGAAQVARGEAMKVWLNGTPFTADPNSIPLTAHAEIVIEVGPPYSKPVAVKDWGKL